MRVLIFDNTGKLSGKFRREILREELASKGAATEFLTQVDEPKGSLILAHSSDASKELKTELSGAASQGAFVALYSGAPDEEEREEEVGAGVRFILRWTTLTEIIRSLPSAFDLSDFRAAYRTTRKRDLLDALVILSWCATFPSESARIGERQAEWRTRREKWQRIFSEKRDELLIACGGTPGGNLPRDMSEVQKLIEWVATPSSAGTSPPSFTTVLEQIKSKFGVVPC
jgi:hypothetical protein